MDQDFLYSNFTDAADFFHMVSARTSSSSSVAHDTCKTAADHVLHRVQLNQTAEIDPTAMSDDDLIKTQIASHPRFPDLVSAYIECQKVGAPPEIASLFENISRPVNHQIITSACTEMGADPELDDFMESYCGALQRYKEELSKPFDEASTFLSNMESELNNLCNGSPTPATAVIGAAYRNYDHSDEAAGSSDEEEVMSCAEGEALGQEVLGQAQKCWFSNDIQGPEQKQGHEHDIRGMLIRKYGSYLGSLRKEFLIKRKKGKLPKDAISALLHWWNLHHRWPYPTEEDKARLSEMTGLDQKQISNWFINQRKRHWKPSDDMKAALFESLSPSTHQNGPSTDDNLLD